MNFLSIPKSPKMKDFESLSEKFEDLLIKYKASLDLLRETKGDFERLMADNIKKDEIYTDMQRYFFEDEKRNKTIIKRLQLEIESRQFIYDIYYNCIKEVTGEDLKYLKVDVTCTLDDKDKMDSGFDAWEDEEDE